MRAFLALLRREYLGHRGAFVYGPLILIGIFVLIVAVALVTGHTRLEFGVATMVSHQYYTGLYFFMAAAWWFYLLGALFFYCADAFNADRRNNAMLFWKSLPVTDFTILLSKLVAGLTIFPALVFAAMLVTGVIIGVVSTYAHLLLPVALATDPAATVAEWGQVSLVALAYLVLGLLWYAPFFAWVGALSTVFGRWSIPLAILVPVVLTAFEGVIDFGGAPGGSYIVQFLKQRLSLNFGFDNERLMAVLLSTTPLDAGALITGIAGAMNWWSVLGGLVFAVLVIWAASEYRRRTLKA